MPSNFLKALGQGLRIAGAAQSDQNFQIYNQQNQFRAQQEDQRRQLILGLAVKARENDSIDDATFSQITSGLGFGSLPSPGISPARAKLNEEQRQFDVEAEIKRESAQRVESLLQQALGAQASTDKEILSVDQVRSLLEKDQNPYVVIPKGTPPDLANAVREASPAFNKTVIDEEAVDSNARDIRRFATDIKEDDLYRISIAMSQYDKDTAARLKDYAEYLYKNRRAREDFERGKRTVDFSSVWTNEDKDYEYVLERNNKGELIERKLTSEEANEIKNKAREKAASKTEVNVYEPAIDENLKLQAKGLNESYNTLQLAPAQLKMIDYARDAIDRARPFTGSFAEAKLKVIKFFNNNFGTRILPEQVASAEELRFTLFNQIMDNLKKLDATPSQLQQQIMMEAMGNLTTDPLAIERILGIYEDAIYDKVEQHNLKARQAKEKIPEMFLYDPVIKMPDRSKKGGKTIRFEDMK